MAIGQIPGAGGPGGAFFNDPNKLPPVVKQFAGNINALIQDLEKLAEGEPLSPGLKEMISDLAGQTGYLEGLPGLSKEQKSSLQNIHKFLNDIVHPGQPGGPDRSDLVRYMQNAVEDLEFPSD